MRKTASQIANTVLCKCAKIPETPTSEQYGRNRYLGESQEAKRQEQKRINETPKTVSQIADRVLTKRAYSQDDNAGTWRGRSIGGGIGGIVGSIGGAFGGNALGRRFMEAYMAHPVSPEVNIGTQIVSSILGSVLGGRLLSSVGGGIGGSIGSLAGRPDENYLDKALAEELALEQ